MNALVKSFRIDGNQRPQGLDDKAVCWWAKASRNGISYFDAQSGRVVHRPRARIAVVDHVFFHVGEHGRNPDEMIGTKTDLRKVASCAVRALQDHIVRPGNAPSNQTNLAIGPYFVFTHNHSLSDGFSSTLPSDAKAGGASSPAREGDAA
jgi:hypothetical protein